LTQGDSSAGHRPARRHLLAGLAVATVFAVFAAMITTSALPNGWDRGVLRQVVSACATMKRTAGTGFPCAEVHLATSDSVGYVRLRPPGMTTESLILPIAPLDGIESPPLQAEAATPLWAAAWAARGAVEDALGHEVPRDGIALAVNARGTRTQDQFHIHVDCLNGTIEAALARRAPDLSDSWALYPDRLRGVRYWARTIRSADLSGVNVAQLVSAGLPGAAAAMDRVTLAVVPMTLGDGTPGFVLLANTANLSAERLLDHSCRGA
jgi:CDP-diacylglycerol pyrophosphatase